MAAVVAVTCAAPTLATPRVAAADGRTVTVAVRFATDRTHAPSGEVTDPGADQRELTRLADVLAAVGESTTLLLVDPATRIWLADFTGTPFETQAKDLATRADARAHMDTVYASARIDKLVASRISQVADGLLAWSTTSTTIYIPAGMDAKTDAFLAERDSVVTALPAGSAPASAAFAGSSPKGARVVVRETALENCLTDPAVSSCLRSELSQSTWQHAMVVTSTDVTGPALGTFLTALRTTAGIVLASTLPTSKDPTSQDTVEVAEVPVAHKYPVPLREALVPALRQAEALNSLFPGTRSTAMAQQAVAAAVSDAIDTSEDPLDLLAEAGVHTRKALGLVRVVTSERFTVSGESADIPITVLNDSEFPVTVTVSLRPDSADRLSPVTSDQITLEPHTRTTVPITVRITGIGTVGASVGVATSDGRPFGVPVHLTITTTAYQKFARNIVWLAFALLVLLAGNSWRVRRRT